MKRMRKLFIGMLIASLGAVALGGCTFIVKNGETVKYYGIDEKRGSDDLNKILNIQQERYEAQKAAVKK